MFTEVGVTVEHTEELTKKMDFDPWADRMGQAKN